jgi:glycosyltransferase involved in cell wall biosynthesis
MPARFWKWRMKGAALYFVEQIKNIEEFDLVFATDLINISDLKILLGNKCPPIILYFHENQLAYPLNENETLDYHYGLTDLTNSLSADGILFNSQSHRSTFLREMPLFLKHLPDFVPDWTVDKIRAKSSVIYPGIEDKILKGPSRSLDKQKEKIPLIIWNHRWEFDKNPEVFFSALFNLKKEGIPFKLALLGERYKKKPAIFAIAESKLEDNIIHAGYLKNYNDYINILKKGDIIISTANQENYGIAVIEAILAGCFPLLPDRLSYPEIIPDKFHNDCLYRDEENLILKLKKLINEDIVFKQKELIDRMSGLYWNTIITEYDSYFDKIINGEA